jgi:hypothetical protein
MNLNKSKIIFLFLFLIIPFNYKIFCQTEKTNPFDIISKTVVKLEFLKNNELYFGTGFIIRKNISYFLCTAAHNAKYINKNSKVIFPTQEGTTCTLKIEDLQFNIFDTLWIYHSHADLALLPINLQSEKTINIDPTSVGEEHNILDGIPARQVELTMIGFPYGLGTQIDFTPLSKRSYIASGSMYLKNPETHKLSIYYLLEDPSVGGFSGSPLYVLPQSYYLQDTTINIRSYFCVGIVSGMIGDTTGAKFAMIVPSSYIKELIAEAPEFTGLVQIFHDNGIIWTERLCKDGKLWEVIFNNNTKGKPVDKGTLKNGNGTIKIYNENDELVEINEYRNGRLINSFKK